MTDELTLLAEAGATAVVATMATDLWQRTKDAVLGLFRRDDPDRSVAVGARLEENAALMRATVVPDDVRQSLSGIWALELAELLRREPTCRAPLARLTAEVDSALAGGSGTLALEQNNTARDSGTVFAVQHGDIHTTREAGRTARGDDGPRAT
ncbi:hypothetical protein [Streptomyces violaceusniger]|uniref:Uncharacterized protein n=1 Tax=Streptomyces violaceusniger (strain Tu 4113) TaxID=653045 RepID=G2PCY9_STRV4|nr:hypothetical protein [Streptomyces violaceusniger]AEM82615.1 hypothetical protein Strvi_2917 [Streptomyces violaceusniger Tu 4113]